MKRENSARVADWFFTVLLLLSIVGVLLRAWDLRQRTDVAVEDYRLLGMCESIDARSAACFAEGESLYTESGEYFGVIRSITRRPARMQIESGGALYESEMPEGTRVEVTIEMAIRGRESGGILKREGLRPLSIGEQISLRSERADLKIRILFWQANGEK